MERLPGCGAISVGLGDQGVGLGASELPGELAPDGVDVGAVVLVVPAGLKWLPTMATRLTLAPL